MNFFEHYLTENASVSMVKMSRMRKRKMNAGLSAIQIAKRENDPLYSKYQRYRERYLQVRQQLLKKYRMRGIVQARKNI